MLSIHSHDHRTACRVPAIEPHIDHHDVPNSPEPVRRAIAGFFKKIDEKRRLARLRRALRGLNDHLLADIGLERRDVLQDRDVLREAQRGFLDRYQRLGR